MTLSVPKEIYRGLSGYITVNRVTHVCRKVGRCGSVPGGGEGCGDDPAGSGGGRLDCFYIRYEGPALVTSICIHPAPTDGFYLPVTSYCIQTFRVAGLSISFGMVSFFS